MTQDCLASVALALVVLRSLARISGQTTICPQLRSLASISGQTTVCPQLT